jgi:hypothetical protein
VATRRRRHLEEDDLGNHQRPGEETSIDNRVLVRTIPRKRNLRMYTSIRSLARTLTYNQIQNIIICINIYIYIYSRSTTSTSTQNRPLRNRRSSPIPSFCICLIQCLISLHKQRRIPRLRHRCRKRIVCRVGRG